MTKDRRRGPLLLIELKKAVTRKEFQIYFLLNFENNLCVDGCTARIVIDNNGDIDNFNNNHIITFKNNNDDNTNK